MASEVTRIQTRLKQRAAVLKSSEFSSAYNIFMFQTRLKTKLIVTNSKSTACRWADCGYKVISNQMINASKA